MTWSTGDATPVPAAPASRWRNQVSPRGPSWLRSVLRRAPPCSSGPAAGDAPVRCTRLPSSVAFGALPHVVSLADPRRPVPAPSWHVVAGALLGVGAHLLDALPDLSIDTATGVNGFPHRVGARRTRRLAGAALAGLDVGVIGAASRSHDAAASVRADRPAGHPWG